MIGFFSRMGFRQRGTARLPSLIIDGDLDVSGLVIPRGDHQDWLPGDNVAIDTIPVAYASNRTVAWCMGKCKSPPTTQIEAGIHVGTSGAAITWAECGIAVGDVDPFAGPNLTPIGWASYASEFAAGNAYHNKVLAMSRMPEVGEFLWFILGNVAGTPTTFRCTNGSDGSGMLVYRDNFRPSLNLGTSGAFTLNSGIVSTPPHCRFGIDL